MNFHKYDNFFQENNVIVKINEGKLSICNEVGDKINIILLIDKQIKIIEPDRQTFEYHVFLLKNGGYYELITLYEDEIINCCERTLKHRFGCKAIGENSGLICRILRESCHIAEETEIYSFNGWGGVAGKRYFICGNRKITSLSVEIIENCDKKAANIANISTMEACNFICNNYLKILNNQLYSRIFLCFCVAANIHQLIKDADGSIDFMLYIYGETGTGKTSTAFPMLNPFDVENCSVADTLAASMDIVHKNRCSVTIMDDVKSRSNKQCVKILDTLSRIAGDRTTDLKRKRGNRVSNVVIHNLIAATAEVEPPLQTSSFPRLLILNFDRETVNGEHLKRMESNLEEFKKKTLVFIVYFLESRLKDPMWAKNIKEKFEKKCRDLINSGTYKLHGRYYNTLAWLIVIWRDLKEFFSSHGCEISEENFESELEEMIVGQHRKYSEKDPAKMYCAALYEMMESGKLKCVRNEDIEEVGNIDIIIKGGELQVKSKTVYQKIKDYYEVHEIDFFWSEPRIRNELNSAGLIRTNSGCKTITTSERRIKGISFSFMSIYRHKFEKFIKECQENG